MKYVIVEKEKFCSSIRKQALKSLTTDICTDIIDGFITIEQCLDIVDHYCAGVDDNGRYVIDEESYLDMLIEISEQIYQSALSKLAAENVIQCAWSEEDDQMIFWIEEENGKIKQILSTLL